MNFQDIKNNAIAECLKEQALEDKIKIHQKQIDRLNKRVKKLNTWWGDILIRPIMNEVKIKYPYLIWDDERLTPMGLRCAVSVFGCVGDKEHYKNTVVAITFTPGNTEKGGIHFDTGERRGAYPSGTIGDLNGFGNVSKEVTSLEDIFQHIDSCIERNKEKLITK